MDLAGFDPVITDYPYALPTKPFLERLFEREVKRAKRHQRPLSIATLSVESLWSVESIYGEEGVLTLLQTLAQKGAALLRDEDVFGHWQGDTFLLIMPETNLRGSVYVLSRLKVTLERYHSQAGRLIFDVGVALLEENDNPFTLLTKADEFRWESRERRRRGDWHSHVDANWARDLPALGE